VQKTQPLPTAPWKTVPVEDHEIAEMRRCLIAISEEYPRANFGAANWATARDILGAAKLANPGSTPDHVVSFLAWKFRDRRPYPYECGIRTFGGILKIVADDLGAWFWSQQQAEPPRAALADTDATDDRGVEETPASGRKKAHFIQAIPPPTAAVSLLARPSACPYCSGRGYRIDDTATECIDGEELRTINASACNCSKGRNIGCRRLAEIERRETEQRGVGWIAEHRPFDLM
jgi:hypothetical protein